MRGLTGLGVTVAITMTIAWVVVSRGCDGYDATLFWAFVVIITGALAGSAYALTRTLGVHWLVGTIVAALVAGLGGLGVAVLLAVLDVAGCLS